MEITEVADGIWFAEAADVNWTVLVEALVLTHHHGDHTGSMPALAARGVRVLAGVDELAMLPELVRYDADTILPRHGPALQVSMAQPVNEALR